jgi:hypothetical protein
VYKPSDISVATTQTIEQMWFTLQTREERVSNVYHYTTYKSPLHRMGNSSTYLYPPPRLILLKVLGHYMGVIENSSTYQISYLLHVTMGSLQMFMLKAKLVCVVYNWCVLLFTHALQVVAKRAYCMRLQTDFAILSSGRPLYLMNR